MDREARESMSVNNDNFLLEPEDMEFVQGVCNNVVSGKRNRAVANVLASVIAQKCLEDYEADADSGIHNAAQVLNNIDISDFYIKGNYVDARIYFNDGELYVPKSHFDLDILPLAYMFIKPDENLNSGIIAGFVFPEDIDKSEEVEGYYLVDEDSLKSMYDLEARASFVEDNGFETKFEKDVYDYLDDKLDNVKEFYKALLESKAAREYFLDAAKAHSIYSSLNIGTTQKQETENIDPRDDLLGETGDLDILEEPEDLMEQAETEMIQPLDDDEVISLDTIDDAEPEELQSLAEDNYSANDLMAEAIEDFSLNEEAASEITQQDEEEQIEEVIPESDEEELSIGQEEFLENEASEETESEEVLTEEETSLPTEEVEEANDETVSEFEYDESEPYYEEVVNEDSKTEDGEYDELAQFDYSTEIMPSMRDIEAGAEEELPESTAIEEGIEAPVEESEDNHQERIDDLFNGEQEEMPVETPKKKSSIMPILGVLVVMGALGYYGYTKYIANSGNLGNKPELPIANVEKPTPRADMTEQQGTAMPNETVEKLQPAASPANEAVSVEIPEIEQNLSASIEISNLTVNWEVPVSYANNATAKRYFVKIGKVLQLNLKTEFLLLSTPPITNKITVELEYNKDNHKFNVGKIIQSSGVKNVDELVQATLKKVLGMNMNVNMNVFDNLQGNPVLVIKL